MCSVASPQISFSRAQVARLTSQYRETGRIEDRRRGPTHPFPRRYTKADIGLLAGVDETLGGLCGAVTPRMMQRQYEVFGDARFERLAGFASIQQSANRPDPRARHNSR